MRNIDVALAWSQGKKAKNGRNNFTTDGLHLWSYALLIGVTTKTGEKIAMSRVPISNTTYRHLSAAHTYADKLSVPVRVSSYGYGKYQLAKDVLEAVESSLPESIEQVRFL